MPTTPILTDSDSIAALAEELHREKVIAVDLEADSMHCYQEKVCLLQFSTPSRTVLVDPLAVSDLAVLRPVLADPAVRKIFHAADYDIRCLYRDFGIVIDGLFDTMIACQFLGEEKVGLADTLNKYYGVVLDKQYQRADWSKRPLIDGMIRYAAEDTRHLHKFAEMVEGKLIEKGRLSWVQEEFTLLEQVRHRGTEGPLYLRAKGAGILNRRQLAVFENLLQLRDREAKRRDVPLYKVLGNKSLMDLAGTMPRTLQGLVGIEGVSPRIVDRYGRDILKAIEEALAIPDAELPIYPRAPRRDKDPAAEKRMTFLKEWRKKASAELGIDPGVLINNALLEELSRRFPRAEADLVEMPGMKNWQREALGAGILRAIGK